MNYILITIMVIFKHISPILSCSCPEYGQHICYWTLPTINQSKSVNNDCVSELMTPYEHFLSYNMARTGYFLIRWWCLLCTRPTYSVDFIDLTHRNDKSIDRHVPPLKYIILTLIQPVYHTRTKHFYGGFYSSSQKFYHITCLGYYWI